MRKPIIAGNWKMYKTPSEAAAFVKELAPALKDYPQAERVVIPPFVALPVVAAAIAATGLQLGAQDVHHQEKGAYTGCIAASMLAGLVEYVIVGHSETRQYLGVTDEMVNQKAKIALAYGLKPIIAMGENLEQNEAGQTEVVCSRQIKAAFAGIEAAQLANIVIAYEPIWAIGTGKSASPDQANDIIARSIRATIAELYGSEAAQAIRIQYGGSVKPGNMVEFMQQPDIDGALVGGASLEVDSFTELVRLAIQAKEL